jgi:hypothetical protein
MDRSRARAIWHRLEALNAVTYFCAECRDAPARLGLQGFWMGYFACRAAPLGPVGPGVVEATFFNFHPERVRRAIPDAWRIVDPAHLAFVRAEAAAAALRRLVGDAGADRLAQGVLPVLEGAIDRATAAGRPLFAANRDLAAPEDRVAGLWQAATTLREHRGDAHVALLTAEGLDGCEVHVLFSACAGAPAEMYRQGRGWSTEDWQRAVGRLAGRRLLADDGTPTEQGRALHAAIEQRTDQLASEPYADLRDDDVRRLLTDLTPAAERVAASGEVMFPNPMGLPRELDSAER